MDVSGKSSEEKSIVVGPFDKNKTTEFVIPVSSINERIFSAQTFNKLYDASKVYSFMPGSKNQESDHLSCESHHKVTICINETDDTKQMPIVFSSKVSNTLETNLSLQNSGIDIENSVTNDKNCANTLYVTSKIVNNAGAITNESEIVTKVSITDSEINNLSQCTEKTDELLMTGNKKTETPSNEISEDIFPNIITKSRNVVINTGRNNILQITYEIEKFCDAIDSTNKDMQKKSNILLQKQNLLDEIISYIHAVQSIIRLSTSRSLFTRIIPKDSEAVYPNKPFYEAAQPFYEAGEHILEELQLYRSDLQADFKVWETYRMEILEISDQMLDDFEYCEDVMTVKVLMHVISTKICQILKRMELVTSKREDKNEKCIDLMDSVDTYIGYSSAFILGERTLAHFLNFQDRLLLILLLLILLLLVK